MKVWELRKQLAEFDDELEVLVSKDEEGNGFNTLYQLEKTYAENTGYEWECYNPVDVTHDFDEAETDQDKRWSGDLREVLVLWP